MGSPPLHLLSSWARIWGHCTLRATYSWSRPEVMAGGHGGCGGHWEVSRLLWRPEGRAGCWKRCFEGTEAQKASPARSHMCPPLRPGFKSWQLPESDQSCSLLWAGAPSVADGFSVVGVVWGREGEGGHIGEGLPSVRPGGVCSLWPLPQVVLTRQVIHVSSGLHRVVLGRPQLSLQWGGDSPSKGHVGAVHGGWRGWETSGLGA